MLQYIVDNAGVTLHELSHSLGMNIGTVRYHLLILGLNHRIVSGKFDDKFVRYFPNSGSYTKNEQLVISIVRRDGIRKVISLLLDESGLTNAEISSKLNIQVSATSRYIKELLEKGLIIKIPQDNGTLGYSIKDDQKEIIANIIERIDTN
jgi:predicted transcriptional regulator